MLCCVQGAINYGKKGVQKINSRIRKTSRQYRTMSIIKLYRMSSVCLYQRISLNAEPMWFSLKVYRVAWRVFAEGTTSLQRKIAPTKTTLPIPKIFKNSFKTKFKNGEGLFEIPPQR